MKIFRLELFLRKFVYCRFCVWLKFGSVWLMDKEKGEKVYGIEFFNVLLILGY